MGPVQSTRRAFSFVKIHPKVAIEPEQPEGRKGRRVDGALAGLEAQA